MKIKIGGEIWGAGELVALYILGNWMGGGVVQS